MVRYPIIVSHIHAEMESKPNFRYSFWGSVATAMAAVSSFASLAVCRLLLGLFEAGKANLKYQLSYTY